MVKKPKGLKSIQQILQDYKLEDKGKYITREFQDYGYRLACQLKDEKRISLYIKLAKVEERKLLEEARIFVKDASNVKSLAKLFLWKLGQLKKEKKESKEKDES